MSQYLPKLHSRDLISWSQPGVWQEESLTKMADFAVSLEVTKTETQADLLNSVPAPWARLLMFETALFNPAHPAHREIVEQWRGLLGLIALSKLLNVSLERHTVRLPDLKDKHEIAKTFHDLSPGYAAAAGAGSPGPERWHDWQLLEVDDIIIGATSPRTLVFTGVAHRCPNSIPFRSAEGRLSDPASYYLRYKDRETLGHLRFWLDKLIQGLRDDQDLQGWLGVLPVAQGGMKLKRSDQLLKQLENWRDDVNAPSLPATGPPQPVFTLPPYEGILTGLPPIDKMRSDFLLAKRDDVMILYSPDTPISSRIYNAQEMELMGESLRVFENHWVEANKKITIPPVIFPKHLTLIADPAAFFEDALLKVDLPDQSLVAYALRTPKDAYLFPFKKEILDYLTPEEINQHTSATMVAERNTIRVELRLPLINQRFIKVVREYRLDAEVFTEPELITPDIAVWPDFVAAGWQRYFYFISQLTTTGIEFEPLSSISSKREIRQEQTYFWLASRDPIAAFVGTSKHQQSHGKQGLLLLHYRSLDPPHKMWRVGVDFGSTHTRVFALTVNRDGNGALVGAADAQIEPVQFRARAREITRCDRAVLKMNFFAPDEAGYDQKSVYKMLQLSSLLYQPQLMPGELADWLPREGYVFQPSLLEIATNYRESEHLRGHLKWDDQDGSHGLRAFFRCLLLMVQAEALEQRARVVEVVHTHPSVLTQRLVNRQNNEWAGVQEYINPSAIYDQEKIRVVPAGANCSETVAVCRHLAFEQHAAPTMNVISLDIGGSTTDLAVWSQNQLRVNESVKAAAGLVANYLKSTRDDAANFRQWFFGLLAGEPYKIEANQKPYDLMFYEALSTAEARNLLGQLIGSMQTAEEESGGLIAHLIYLFSMMLYYAGLTARKAGLHATQEEFYVYFCGKGGQLVTWVPEYTEMVEGMFLAGLHGPHANAERKAPSVQVKLSKYPKEEVGRGLLAASMLQADKVRTYFGEQALPPSVTVGETGYKFSNQCPQWGDDLSPEILKQLQQPLPALAELHELRHFMLALHANRATQHAARVLRLPDPEQVDHEERMRKFRASLAQRLFGMQKGAILQDLQDRPDEALLESLLITELKVLLETLTETPQIFN
ncbi:MAG: hypothetical protein ACREA2_04040 [Blastocatellia bacterium]